MMNTGRGAAARRIVAITVVVAGSVSAPAPSAAQAPEEVFHSTQSANLPTATTIRKGVLMFEISHRFLPAISEGADALWGLDGPVYNRLGLAYAASDEVLVGLQRSNLDDNLELNAKARVLQGSSGSFAYVAAVMAGFAVNLEPVVFEGTEDNETQLYVQGIINAGFGDRLALGLVPTYFRNPRLTDVDVADTFTLGVNGQYYASDWASFLVEWVAAEESVDFMHDGVSFGVELETRGHFFKVLVTNQPRMNPTQYLVGARDRYGSDDWRLGFNITRLLSF